jgi:aminoglycoside 3-N-acetyltransferase
MASTRTSLAQDLRHLGLEPGQIVMLHASVRAVGRLVGGPDEIHLAVADAIAPGGTVMMYAGCPDGFDDVGRGVLSPEEESAILAHQPAFDFRHARAARDFGILAEFFRSYPGAICSEAVCARMAARGTQAEWLMADPPWNYGFGRGSPLDKLCASGGKVLLLGSRHDEVTLLHYAEHIASFEGKRIARYKVPILRDGARLWLDCEEFNTSGEGVHENWAENAFELIVDDFIAKRAGTPACRVGQVGLAESVFLDAAELVAHAVPIMEGWADGQDIAPAS